MAIEQIVYEDVDWIYLAHDRDHWRTRVNFRVPRNSGNFLTSLTTLGFSLIALMMEAVRTSETSFIYLTIHCSTSQNTLNFILAAVRT
jgi:hypothetical protein